MRRFRKHPFTLVEMMVAMAVLVIMMSFLFQFVIGAQRIWSSSSGTADTYDQASILLTYMQKDIANIPYIRREGVGDIAGTIPLPTTLV